MGLKDRSLAFIGGGHITEIIVSRLTKTQKLSAHRMIVSDPVESKAERLQKKYAVSIAEDNWKAVLKADFVFINVPPDAVADVVSELNEHGFPEKKVIITVAGGIPMQTYAVLGDRVPVVRALPNPPSQVGMGIAALAFNPHVAEDMRAGIYALFACLGEYVEVKEEHIDTVMALSSPAITYLLFQSAVDAGVRAGLNKETSTKIVYQTIAGAMAVWKIRQVPPYELIGEASTPGGISVESLFTLETYAFKAAVMEAVDSAIKKAAELGIRRQMR